MRCPKCGAFMEDGRDVCFMCGTNVKTFNPMQNSGGFYNSTQNGFSTGMNNNGAPQGNGFPVPGDYDKIYNTVKENDKDVFDFFADHKWLLRFVAFVGLIIVLLVSGLIYYKVRLKDPKVTPLTGQLYYKIDKDMFKSGAEGIYTSTGSKGSVCDIAVNSGNNTSTNYIDSAFTTFKNALEPQRDEIKLAVVDTLKIYTAQEGQVEINDTVWYFLNIYYPPKIGASPTLLKYKILSTIHNGYYYNVELRNPNDDSKCSYALDTFARSLRFIDDYKIKEDEA